jgi:hypothetical protein
VEALDIVEDVGSSVTHGQVAPSVDALALEHTEEPLGRGVIAAVTDGTRAQREVVVFKELLVLG